MTHGSLFSGIGGFDLAAEWMGWENMFHCEWNEFGQKVLKYYWPNATTYGDIDKADFTIWRGLIDVLSGGFPCQPYSTAGKRKGKEDARHKWPQMLRAIREIQPRWVVGENVRGLTNWNGGMVFDEVQADLEAEGYEVLPFLLPACGVNAPHRRDRIWFVASNSASNGHSDGFEQARKQEKAIESKKQREEWNKVQRERNGHNAERINAEGVATNSKSNGDRRGLYGLESENGSIGKSKECRENNLQSWDDGEKRVTTNTNSSERLEGRLYKEGSEKTTGHISTCNARINGRATWQNFPTQSPIRSRNDGLPGNLAGITISKHRNESIKGFGNAIVPQVVYQIFQAISEWEELSTLPMPVPGTAPG